MKIKLLDISRSTLLEGLYDWDSVSIPSITEKKMPDSYCYAFSSFLEDFGVENDIVNTEYMGYLTMKVKKVIGEAKLVEAINLALKELKL